MACVEEGPSRWALTDEVGRVGGPEEVRQVQPLDECRVHGDGLAPAPRIVCRWKVSIRAPDIPSLSPSAGLQPPGPVSLRIVLTPHVHSHRQPQKHTHRHLEVREHTDPELPAHSYVHVSQA